MKKTPAIIPKMLFFIGAFTFYIAGMSHMSIAENADQRLQRHLDKARLSPVKLQRKAIRLDLFHIISKRAPGLPEADRWKLSGAVVKYSIAYGHDPYLLMAVIETESAYQSHVVSQKGAVGYMQLRPFVAKAIAIEIEFDENLADSALTDLDTNVRLGAYYLSKMKLRFKDIDLALVAYNLGPTRLQGVLSMGRKPSMEYTIKVLNSRKRLIRLSPMAAAAGKNSV